MPAESLQPSKHTGSARKGKAAEHLIAATCILASGGELNASTSLVDDEGVDIVFHRRGRSRTLAVQVKSRFDEEDGSVHLFKERRFIGDVRALTFQPRDSLYLLFGARQLQRLANAHNPEPTDPVFWGLQGGRLQETILADIIRRAATRAGIEKHVTAHTLRHTAATWLRQELGGTRLVAEYLGRADLSTVARYAHVDREELYSAAGRLEQLAVPSNDPRAPPDMEPTPDIVRWDQPSVSGETATEPAPGRRRPRRRHGRHRR